MCCLSILEARSCHQDADRSRPPPRPQGAHLRPLPSSGGAIGPWHPLPLAVSLQSCPGCHMFFPLSVSVSVSQFPFFYQDTSHWTRAQHWKVSSQGCPPPHHELLLLGSLIFLLPCPVLDAAHPACLSSHIIVFISRNCIWVLLYIFYVSNIFCPSPFWTYRIKLH